MNATEHLHARLHALRDQIDIADRELLRLLSQRALLSLEVGRIKEQMSEAGNPGGIFDPQRERQVLDNLAAWNTGMLSRQDIENIWREIFSSSRALQEPNRPEGDAHA